MKKQVSAWLAVLWTLFAAASGVFAQSSESQASQTAAQALTLGERMLWVGKSIGYFLLVMAALYACLFLTKKIGEWRKKH